MNVLPEPKENTFLFIVSAQRNDLSPEQNKVQHDFFVSKLSKLAFITHKNLEGSYNGTLESSVLLQGTNQLQAHTFAAQYSQECFLRLEPHKDGMYLAHVVFTETKEEKFIGFFRSIALEIIKELNLDYSKDLKSGTYYTVWPSDTTNMKEFNDEVNEAKTLIALSSVAGRT